MQTNSHVYGKQETTYLHLETANGKLQTGINNRHMVSSAVCRKRVSLSSFRFLLPAYHSWWLTSLNFSQGGEIGGGGGVGLGGGVGGVEVIAVIV